MNKDYYLKKLKEFNELEENWDCYGAIPTTNEVVKSVIKFINIISDDSIDKITYFYPSTNGTIIIEWEEDLSNIKFLEIGKSKMGYFIEKNNIIDKMVDFAEITEEEILKFEKLL